MPEAKNNDFIKSEFKSVSDVKKGKGDDPFDKYRGNFRTSFGTLLLGFILFIVGLVLLGYSEGLDNDLNSIRRSPSIRVDNLFRNSGFIKLIGEPSVDKALNVSGYDGDLIYYSKTIEEKIDEGWVKVEEQKNIASFSLGDIRVDASNAILEFDLVEIYTNENGNQRESVYGVPAKGEVTVIGDLKDKVMSGGAVFVVTNKSNRDIGEALSHVDRFGWWLFKVGALLLITLGIVSFILPIITFIDIFPQIGLGTIGLIFLFSFVISALLVFISAVVITFWWMIFIVAGLVVILLVRIKSKKKHGSTVFVP